MTESGYQGTSIARIAAAAGVAPQTVYNSVGSKRDVLEAVLDRAAAGPQSPRTVPEFMQERGEHAATAVEFVEQMADWFTEVHPRLIPVLGLIRDAAAVDPAIADLEQARAAQRLRNYGLAAEILAQKTGARNLPADQVAASLWSIGHPEVFRQLEKQGWTSEHYRAWVATTLRAILVVE
ncbi:TetR family transcriptional regulator [Microbacterium sp. CH12i]|uniref:TetR family transcriptional regulator n=1 Tax=Microbacterium sp. CH12i TaxID=1479651 RepID=UPI001267B2AB|nr:TetR family transcriptional regulator [Microbacterium sp. CH12i]